MERLPLRRSILVLFFLSGACALVYEVVWMRMLTLVFGATAFAASTILATFFAGLALGSFHFGRVADRSDRSPLVTYALLELGIAGFAFVMPLLFAGVQAVYVGIARSWDVGFYPITAIRFVLSFLVLVVPATLMGGTLPVMVKFFARRRERLAWNVGQLYAVNTFGAVVGAMAAGFLLILLFGVREAAWLAGVVNLGIAGAVLWLHRISTVEVSERAEASKASAAEVGAPEGPAGAQEAAGTASGAASGQAADPGAGEAAGAFPPELARLALWAVAVSGFCALALEVLWTRSLVFFLDNSSHAFTTMLTAFLLGIGLGSLVLARFIDAGRRLVAWLGVIQLLIGVSALLAIPILNRITPVFGVLAGESVDALLPWKWIGMRFVNSLSVMLVPTVLMGMSFPLAVKIYTRSMARVGTAVGNVYSVNTFGGVAGSVLSGFVLIPLIGVQNGIILIAAINLVLGVVLVAAEPQLRGRLRLATAAAGALVFVAVAGYNLATGAFVLTSYYEAVEEPETLFYREGVGATVKVYRDRWDDRALSVNGFPVAGTALPAVDIQKPLAHLPLLLSPVDSPRVNIVGFGAGGTSWEMVQHGGTVVECVELVPAVLEAAAYFPTVNHGVLDEPRFDVTLGDGRNHALVTDEEYDIVSVDATSPKMAGNGSLYTLEFYETVRANLSDAGIMVQWVPFHLLSMAETRMIVRTFVTAFPHSTLWFTPLHQYVVLVGTKEELEIDYQSLGRKLRQPAVQASLAELRVEDPVDVLSWYVMAGDALAEYAGDVRLNTDNHPYLEFTPAMAYFVSDQYRMRNLATFAERRESVLPLVTNLGGTEEEAEAVRERIRTRSEAVAYSLLGDLRLLLGQREEAVLEYRQALAIDPDEKNWLTIVPGTAERRAP